MRILYYDWHSNSTADICQGFEALGFSYDIWHHELSNYEHDEIFQKDLCNRLKSNVYDCIFSFDYIPLLSYVAMQCGILYYSWIYDCPQLTLFSDSVYNDCNRIFCFDRQQCLYLADRGVKHVFHLPLAVNVNKFRNIHSLAQQASLSSLHLADEEFVDSFRHDVSFIGSLYNDNMYNRVGFLPQYLRGYLDGMIHSQLNVFGYDLIRELLSLDVVEALDKYILLDDSVDIKLPHDVVFHSMLYSRLAELERKEVLFRCSKHVAVALYTGSQTDDSLRMNGNIKVMPPVDYDTGLPLLYRHSKINLNITCRSITSGMPLRVLDVMGSGGFLLSNYQPELAEFFVPGEELVLYDSMADLEDKVCYYLAHDEERRRIALNGYRKVCEQFSYEKKLKEMFELGMR